MRRRLVRCTAIRGLPRAELSARQCLLNDAGERLDGKRLRQEAVGVRMPRCIARERRHEHDVDPRRDLPRFGHRSYPSISGMTTSTSMSGIAGCRFSAASAACGPATATTSWPARTRTSLMSSRTCGSSSTTSTGAVNRRAANVGSGRAAGSEVAGKSIVNVVPTPTADSTWIRPPACLTIASTLASPTALPPASSLAKERLEQPRLRGRGHPAAGVRDDHPDVLASCVARRVPRRRVCAWWSSASGDRRSASRHAHGCRG